MKLATRLLRMAMISAGIVALAGFLWTVDAKASREPQIERTQNIMMFGGLGVSAVAGLALFIVRRTSEE